MIFVHDFETLVSARVARALHKVFNFWKVIEPSSTTGSQLGPVHFIFHRVANDLLSKDLARDLDVGAGKGQASRSPHQGAAHTRE